MCFKDLIHGVASYTVLRPPEEPHSTLQDTLDKASVRTKCGHGVGEATASHGHGWAWATEVNTGVVVPQCTEPVVMPC